jgi:hypothetical protein
MQMSIFSLEELLVNPSQSQDYEKDLMTRVATSCLPTLELLTVISQNGLSGKTSPVFCRVTEDGILEPSSKGWRNSGMGSPTEFLTLNSVEHMSTLEPSLSEGGVCSLSDVLETQPVPRRFFLSAKACNGILRRAQKRGKALPPMLEAALKAAAEDNGPPR